jgi:hypothetical protein
VTIAYVVGGLCFVLGVAVDRLLVATREINRENRRRARRHEEIEMHGADAVESWLTETDWSAFRPTNGTPFEGDNVA